MRRIPDPIAARDHPTTVDELAKSDEAHNGAEQAARVISCCVGGLREGVKPA